jgi:hypothetical protein
MVVEIFCETRNKLNVRYPLTRNAQAHTNHPHEIWLRAHGTVSGKRRTACMKGDPCKDLHSEMQLQLRPPIRHKMLF